MSISVFFIGKNIHLFVKKWQREIKMNTKMPHSSWRAYWQHITEGSFWSTHSRNAPSCQFYLAFYSTRITVILFKYLQLSCKLLFSNISFCFGNSVHTCYTWLLTVQSMPSLSHCFIISSYFLRNLDTQSYKLGNESKCLSFFTVCWCNTD